MSVYINEKILKQERIHDKKETLSDWVIDLVENFLTRSPLNNLQNEGGDPAWEEVLVGFASGADPLFQEFKEYIGPFHWTPLEIF